MPKLKNKSGAKKRFTFTANNKIKAPKTNKKHNMVKRSKKQIRMKRGNAILNQRERYKVRAYIPYFQ